MKKFLTPMLALCFATAVFSCNSSTEKKEEPAKVADTTAIATPPPAPAAFTPFDVVEIMHSVKDYAKWRPLFNADSPARRASGLEDLVVGRGLEKDNDVLVVLKASDVQKAKAFGADPRLKAAMEKGGITSKPDIEYFHIIRFNPDSKEKEWVTITHKVKDFNAWLKVFDSESTATRASFGLVDVALGRGIDDSTLVHIVFDIKDMAKAKARMNDPALKKLMMDGGVMGAPKIVFYKNAD
jgi:hypothetical protein